MPDVLNKRRYEIWAEVKATAQEAFGLKIPDSFQEWKGYAILPLLRAICRYTGIQLTNLAIPAPLTAENIAALVPLLKTIDSRNSDAHSTREVAIGHYQHNDLDKAIECFQYAI